MLRFVGSILSAKGCVVLFFAGPLLATGCVVPLYSALLRMIIIVFWAKETGKC